MEEPQHHWSLTIKLSNIYRTLVGWVLSLAETQCVCVCGGGVVNCKVLDFHQIKGKLNQTGYHSIRKHHLILSRIRRLVDQGLVLIQDDDPKYTSKLCQKYIKSKEELQLMSWPAQSTDLNPIELVCDEIDRKVRAKQPASAVHLRQLLEES